MKTHGRVGWEGFHPATTELRDTIRCVGFNKDDETALVGWCR